MFSFRYDKNVKYSFPSSQAPDSIDFQKIGFDFKMNFAEKLMDANELKHIKGNKFRESEKKNREREIYLCFFFGKKQNLF